MEWRPTTGPAIGQDEAMTQTILIADDHPSFLAAARLRAAGTSSAIVFTSSRDGSDFGPLIADSGACGIIGKPELSGDARRALVS